MSRKKTIKQSRYLFEPDTASTEGMVSISQLTTLMSCRRRWQYGYVEKLMPRVEKRYLTIGKLCHVGMQHAMLRLHTEFDDLAGALDSGITAMYDAFHEYLDDTILLEEELPGVRQTLAEAVEVFKHAWYDFGPHQYEVVTINRDGVAHPALELHFCVPCAGTKGLHGYIDAILRDRISGAIWCVDYKFRSSFSNDDEEMFNTQNAVYAYACAKIGIPITGTLTYQHSNNPPAVPSINKNGTISRARIRTTWPLYAQFCVDNNQDPNDYVEEMSEKLGTIEWSRCTKEFRNPHTTTAIWHKVILPMARIAKSAANKPAYLNMYPWNCRLCQFKSLCQAELRGYDANFIRVSEYMPKSGYADNKPIDNDNTDMV